MQDPTSITSSTPSFPELKTPQLQFPEQEQLKCPRCDSNNTKFCYYNNYNLSQPRHYCKNCRRYWTKGGALRNIPIGGGSRKNTKRSSSSSKRSSSSAQTHFSAQKSEPETETKPDPIIGSGLGLAGEGVGVESFTSLLGMAPEGQFGNLVVEGVGSNGLWLGEGDGPGQNPGLELIEGNNGDHQSCWGGSNNSVWPDLAIYTQPGSKF